jgi:hypothetical protein
MLQDITNRKQLEEKLKQHGEHLEAMVKTRAGELEEALHVKNRFLGKFPTNRCVTPHSNDVP